MAIALSATGLAADELRFWTTEEQPERLARQEAMAADFAAASGHTVEVIPVTENDLGTRATAAFAAGDLPDVIYHPLQYAAPWAEAGILDTDAATDAIEALGGDTFAQGALSMVAVDGGYASVPVDGWTQMLVYRADLFAEKGLEPPNSYAQSFLSNFFVGVSKTIASFAIFSGFTLSAFPKLSLNVPSSLTVNMY